jgi:PAS domain S-box-containing protein
MNNVVNNASQNNTRQRFSIRRTLGGWRKLPILYKLLIPTAFVVLATMGALAITSTPLIDTVIDANARIALNIFADEIEDELQNFFAQVSVRANGILENPQVVSLTTQQLLGNVRAATVSGVNADFGRLLTEDLTEITYYTAEGEPLITVRRSETAGIRTITTGKRDRIAPHLIPISALPEESLYVLPLEEATEPTAPVLEIAVPVFQSVRYAGILVLGYSSTAITELAESQARFREFDLNSTILVNDDTLLLVRPTNAQNPLSLYGSPAAFGFRAPASVVRAPDSTLIEDNNIFYIRHVVDLREQNVTNSVWTVIVSEGQPGTTYSPILSLRNNTAVIILALFSVLFLLVAFLAQRITRPLTAASRTARRLSEGDLRARVEVESEDEIGQLGAAMNVMSSQLGSMIGTLESRVAERTRNLELVAAITRDAAQLRDLDELLMRTINAIRDRFGFYHAQVFLVDDARENAVLVTSTGDAGRILLDRKHKLPVGSNSIVGQVTEKGRTFITLDTTTSEVPHRYNPVLPLTRSEMALPLRVGSEIIGALDIQSIEPDAFDQDDVEIFQVLADQLAISIDNARLLSESERRLKQVDDLNRQLTRSSWAEFIDERSPETLSYQYDLLNVKPAVEDEEDEENPATKAPIRVRGEVIGELAVRDVIDTPISDADQSLVQAVAERVALAIENMRLVEQTRDTLNRIEQLYQATRTLGSVNEQEELFRAAAQQLAVFEYLDIVALLLSVPNPDFNAPNLDQVEYWQREQFPPSPFTETRRVPRKFSPVVRMKNPRAPVVFDLDGGGPQFSDSVKRIGLKSAAFLPITTNTRWFGGLAVYSRRDDAFRENFLQFATAITDQFAVALENRFLFNEIQAEARRNRALAEAAQIASQIGVDFEFGINDLLRTIATSADYDRWWFGQVDEAANTLRRISVERIVLEDVDIETDPSPVAEAARLDQIVLLNDATRTTGGLTGFGKHIASPVRLGNKVIGVLLVGRNAEMPDMDERDVQLIAAVCSQIAVALENKQLFAAAEAGRETLQSIIDSLPTGVMVFDAQTRRAVLINETAQTLLGLNLSKEYTRVRTNTDEPYPPEQFAPLRVLEDGEPIYGEDFTVSTDDGDSLSLIVNAVPILDNQGEIVSAVAVIQDVTELRELEQELQGNLRETTTLYGLVKDVTAESDLPSVLRVVAQHLYDALKLNYLYVLINDENDKVAQVYKGIKLDTPIPSGIFDQLGEERMWRVLLEAQPEGERNPIPRFMLLRDSAFVDSNITLDENIAPDHPLLKNGIVSIGVFPLNARNRQVGWLVVGYDYEKTLAPEEKRILSTISDQAAIAAETARLADQTFRALAETKQLYEAGYAVNRAETLTSAMEILRDQSLKLGPSQVDVYLYTSREAGAPLEWVVRYREDEPDTHGAVSPTDRIIIEDGQFLYGDAYFIEDVATSSAQNLRALRTIPNWGEFVAQASVPLTLKRGTVGRLVLSFDSPRRFNQADRRFLTTLADQAAVIIDNIGLVRETQTNLDETQTLYDSTRAIVQSPDLSSVLDAIVRIGIATPVSTAALIRLIGADWNAPDASIELVAFYSSGKGSDLTGLRLTPQQFPLWDLISSKEIVWKSDMLTEKNISDDLQSVLDLLEIRSLVVLPLSAAGQTIGAMLVGANEPWERSERELRVFTSLADQAAISMESRNLLQQAERRARQLQTSAQVSRAASSILDLQELLDTTVNLIKASFNYDHVQIFLVEPQGIHARLVSSTGDAGAELLRRKHSLPVGSQSVIGRVTALGEYYIASDTTDRRVIHRPNPVLPKTRAEMAIPLIARQGILGALDVQANIPGAFGAEDVNVLTLLADQIAVAINNAQLFEDSQRQRREQQFLFDATRAAAGFNSEAATAIRSVIELVAKNMNAATATLMLPDETGKRLIPYSATLSGTEVTMTETYDVTAPLFLAAKGRSPRCYQRRCDG